MRKVYMSKSIPLSIVVSVFPCNTKSVVYGKILDVKHLFADLWIIMCYTW